MRTIWYAAAVLAIAVAAGCARYGALDEDYGKSYAMAKAGQILHPEASKNPAPVTGLAGPAAEAVMEKYTDSFAGKDCKSSTAKGSPTALPAGKGTGNDVYGK
jgi:hypothetical protein